MNDHRAQEGKLMEQASQMLDLLCIFNLEHFVPTKVVFVCITIKPPRRAGSYLPLADFCPTEMQSPNCQNLSVFQVGFLCEIQAIKALYSSFSFLL